MFANFASFSLLLFLLGLHHVSAQTIARTTTPRPFTSRTIRYAASFSIGIGDGHSFAPVAYLGNTSAGTFPDEGGVSVSMVIARQSIFTTVIKMNLYADRKVVLDPRTYDFDVAVQLRSYRNAQPISIGARSVFTISQGYDGYGGPNPTLALRWPISWTTVLQQYADTQGNLIMDVQAIVANPLTANPILPTTTPNPWVQRPVVPNFPIGRK